MPNPDAKEPATENAAMYEKRVPVMSDCAKTLNKISKTVSRFFITERETITGKFAMPSRIKGSGLGIAYSTAARNMQSAEKKGTSRSVLDSVCIIF